MKIAAIADIHIGYDQTTFTIDLLSEISNQADVLVIAGDLTAEGTQEEAEQLNHLLQSATIPVLMVFGNHDCQNQKEQELASIFRNGGHVVLDGDCWDHNGIGFAGIKGFSGGFGQYILGSWGEQATKSFVEESVNEMLKLERALSVLDTEKKVVITHYAPVKDTIVGEPEEIYPFLGCSRLETPINNHPTIAVFHGHAHHGTFQGKTSAGIPVYNVSSQVLQKQDKQFALIEV